MAAGTAAGDAAVRARVSSLYWVCQSGVMVESILGVDQVERGLRRAFPSARPSLSRRCGSRGQRFM